MARYLLVGHLTRDLIPEGGFYYGGAVLYAGLTARRLGFETRVITASAEKDLPALFPEIQFLPFPAPETTVFLNQEEKERRQQRVLAKAPHLFLEKIPPGWRKAEIVHLAPVLDEVDPQEARIFETDFLVANPQGWFRRVLPDGRVTFREPDLSGFPLFKALVISEEDIGGRKDLLYRLQKFCHFLVLTQGAKGATLFMEGKEYFFPAIPRKVKDTIGAGDILAAGFFALLYATGKPLIALPFAMCLASFSVTRKGLASVPTREEISQCLEQE